MKEVRVIDKFNLEVISVNINGVELIGNVAEEHKEYLVPGRATGRISLGKVTEQGKSWLKHLFEKDNSEKFTWTNVSLEWGENDNGTFLIVTNKDTSEVRKFEGMEMIRHTTSTSSDAPLTISLVPVDWELE